MTVEVGLVLLITVARCLCLSREVPRRSGGVDGGGALVVVGLFQHLVTWMRPERWITPSRGFWFQQPRTITVAAMFVLSAGLQKTGAVAFAARLLKRLTEHPTGLLLTLVLSVGVVSAFINNTAAVAVFLPLTLAACASGKVSPSKLLIPLSFAPSLAASARSSAPRPTCWSARSPSGPGAERLRCSSSCPRLVMLAPARFIWWYQPLAAA